MAKKVRRSNVKDGVLLPLGNGFSLVKGNHPNKVDDVDIGPNNENGLSVNHGEILQQKGGTLRVFSAEPMFEGISPTQLLYGGLAPDKVFAMQEQWKKINKINDDGSRRAKFGTEEVVRNKQTWDTILNDEQEVAFNDWYKNISSKLKLNSNPNNYEHSYDYRGYWLENKDNNIDYSAKDFHFPDKYKKPTHETFSNESIYATEEYAIDPKSVGYWKNNIFIPGSFNILMKNDNKNSLDKEGFYYNDDKQLSSRQRYAESSFNDKALNKYSKAAGAYQIMPHIHKAYVKATGHEGDLYDLEYNTAIRNWLMEDINKNSNIKDSRNNNRNRLIKTYAAYNWGSGNLGKLLKRLEKEGVDTFNSYNWIDKLPKETKDYVNFIVHGDDVNDVKNSKKYKEALDSLKTKKEFGGQININSLGERPNAKYGKEMKNKRIKGQFGLYGDFSGNKTYWYKDPNTGIMMPRLGVPFEIGDKYNTPSVTNPTIDSKVVIGSKPKLTEYDTQMFHKRTPQQYTIDANSKLGLAQTVFNGQGNKQTQPIIPKDEIVPIDNKWLGSADMYDAIGTGINILGSVASNMINRRAINNLQFTPRQYVLKDPVKLKTKINIKPQLAQLNDIRSKLFKSALASSGSSRNFYNRLLEGHDRMTASLMNLHGQKENQETQLINQDLLNQQGVRHANADTVMNTVNTNISGNDQLNNTQRMLHGQNNIGTIINIAGAIAGERGYLARREARIKDINDTVAATLPYYKEFKSMVQDGTIDDYYKWIAAMRNRGRLI